MVCLLGREPLGRARAQRAQQPEGGGLLSRRQRAHGAPHRGGMRRKDARDQLSPGGGERQQGHPAVAAARPPAHQAPLHELVDDIGRAARLHQDAPLHLTLGLVFLGHGAQKALGSFGGPGFAGATGFIGSLGLRPARFWTALAVGGELLAGLLLLLGLLTPVAGLLVLATMAVAIAKVHGPKGFFVQNGGYEYNLVLIIAAVALALVGPGAFSLDHLLGLVR